MLLAAAAAAQQSSVNGCPAAQQSSVNGCTTAQQSSNACLLHSSALTIRERYVHHLTKGIIIPPISLACLSAFLGNGHHCLVIDRPRWIDPSGKRR